MRLHQVAWILWIVGTILIVGSWAGVVSVTVGWIGFGIAGVGALMSWVPVRADPSLYPQTQEGFPVEPSGAPIPPDMTLQPGMPLLAYSQGQWWRATVITVEDGNVVVSFPGWDARWIERIPRGLLQIDPDPSRMPISLPTDPLQRWKQPPSEGTGIATPQDEIQK